MAKTTGRAARTVFYAWQKDSSEAVNRYLIQEALKRAIKRTTNADGAALPVEYDEAT